MTAGFGAAYARHILRTGIADATICLIYAVMSAYYTIVSTTQTSSLMVFAPNTDEALRRYDQMADGTKRHVATFDDAGTELTRDDLMRLTADDAPPLTQGLDTQDSDTQDSAAQDLAIKSTASP